MRPTIILLLCAALGGLPVLAALNLTPPCQVEAAIVSPRNSLGQYRLEIRVQQACQKKQLARIITRNGGMLPPFGYFPLGAGFPLYWNQWVFRGARVEVRQAPNMWVDIPIRGASWPR